jgi:ABC-2 type transport system ATP-binding protein
MIAQKNIRDFLKFYNQQEKATIMLTSHYLEDIENLCERAIVINHGTLAYDGKLVTINEKLAQKKLVKVKTQDKILDFDHDRMLLRNNEGGILTLEVNKSVVQQVITELLSKYDIKDFSVEDIPLEESLEMLYR